MLCDVAAEYTGTADNPPETGPVGFAVIVKVTCFEYGDCPNGSVIFTSSAWGVELRVRIACPSPANLAIVYGASVK